jgi:hypothetical protein
MVGVHQVTLQKWLARGQTGEEPYARFRTAYFDAYAGYVANRLRATYRTRSRCWTSLRPGISRERDAS